MTTEDHISRVRSLALNAAAWEAQDDTPVICACPTCGVATQMLRGEMVSRGWDRAEAARIVTFPPVSDAHPHLASVRVDGREVYRVHADLAEVMEPDVLDDVEAALRVAGC